MNNWQEQLQTLLVQDLTVRDFLQKKIIDGIWLWYQDMPNSKLISPRFLELLGYATTKPWTPTFHQEISAPNTSETWQQFIQACKQNVNAPQRQYFQFIHKKGHSVWMDCRSIFFPEKPNQPILLTFVDITTLKAKEKLLLETNRNAKIGAWEADLTTNELFWSSTTKAIHEVPPDFQPSLEDGINFYKEGYSRDTITRCIQEGLEKGTPWNVELKIITYTNREIWVRAIGNVAFHNGNALRIYGSFQDIDRDKKIEEKLRELSVSKAKSDDLKEFAYIVSHNLREPLASMLGYIQLLQEDFSSNLSADAQELIAVTRQTATRMDTLIHDLLSYSGQGQTKDKQLVDIAQVIEEVLYDLSATISETKAIFKIGELPTVYAYPSELKAVFQNIISNAIKFRKRSIIPRIDIYGQVIEQGWEFRVTDNGIGIPAGEEQKIFNIFQRIHREQYSGTGIGLANCKKIVEHHSGQMWVESKLGVGSSFCFTILN